ncbi:hypothetical protein [Methanococcoides sp. AM1]|uniref:hypothetical protein n=1 Tax=Methanococcoides sp. AM1 TaxID=1201011 RepID=UPI0014385DBC|nr:hypothetical protein [Methanococcoides sp. AM1]
MHPMIKPLGLLLFTTLLLSGLANISTNSPELASSPTEDHHEITYSDLEHPSTANINAIDAPRYSGNNRGKRNGHSHDDKDEDDNDNDDGNETLNNASMYSGVSLGAEIIPAVGVVATPGTINFGCLEAGEVSDVKIIKVHNGGGADATISVNVIGTADDLFISGLHINSGVWYEYSALLGPKEMGTADLTLHVPSDYSNIGSMKGILVVWAEIE